MSPFFGVLTFLFLNICLSNVESKRNKEKCMYENEKEFTENCPHINKCRKSLSENSELDEECKIKLDSECPLEKNEICKFTEELFLDSENIKNCVLPIFKSDDSMHLLLRVLGQLIMKALICTE